MAYSDRNTLFIFLDESGNLDFSPTGTRYWILTALCTFHPVEKRDPFHHLLYDLADRDCGQECFHATEDKQLVRDEVFKHITALDKETEIHSIIAEKCMANPVLYEKQVCKKGKYIKVKDASLFYDRVCRALLKYIFKSWRYKQAEKIVVVLSSLFTPDRHSAIKATLKNYLKNETKPPFQIYFHSNRADMNCQIADYCCWAIAAAWERKELRSKMAIHGRIKSEYNIFRNGDRKYY